MLLGIIIFLFACAILNHIEKNTKRSKDIIDKLEEINEKLDALNDDDEYDYLDEEDF